MIRDSRIATVVLAVFCAALLIPAPLFADGYRNTPIGSQAIGSFGGYRVFADDANATVHNAANLVGLEDPLLQLNVVGGLGKNTFETMGGAVSDETEDDGFVIPSLAAVIPLQENKTALGIAIYVPYGRSVDWGENDFFAQNGVPYYGQMMVLDITPNLAIRLNKAVSISIGADIYNGEVEQRWLAAPGTLLKLTGDGSALGGNAALAWQITGSQRLAATIRSPFAIDYSGEIEGDPRGNAAVTGTIDYPTIAALAYGIELTDTFRIEADVEWLEFSRYQELVIADQFGNTTTAPQDLENTWTVGAGLAWNFLPKWTLRSGFMYLENPTPDSTYSPLGPDEDQEVVSLGLGYATGRHSIDLAYALGLFDGRDIAGSANSPDGTYDYELQILNLSYGCKF